MKMDGWDGHLCHLFNNNLFIDFKDLIQNHRIDGHPFLNNSQLKSMLKSKININDNRLEPSEMTDNIILFRNFN